MIHHEDLSLPDFLIYPDYYALAAVCIDDMTVQPIDFCELYPFAFGTAMEYLVHERYSNNRFQDLCKALTYLNHCEASCVVYPVHALTSFELRIVNEFRKKYYLIELLLNTNGVADKARMKDTMDEIERRIIDLNNRGLEK